MGWRDWFGAGNAETTEDLLERADAARVGASTPRDPLAEVNALVAGGEKIQAIKIYREHYGTSLADAKDAIEAIARGETAATPPTHRDQASDAEVVALIDQGKLIDAIKAYRELHDVGLKEAKDAVDRLRA